MHPTRHRRPRRMAVAMIAATAASTLPGFAAATDSGTAWLFDRQARLVRLFDRPPSPDEVRDILAPDAGRTRSIEIVGGGMAAGLRAGPMPTPAAAQMTERPAAENRPEPEPEPEPQPPAMAAPAPPAAGGALGFRINFAFDSAVIPRDAFAYIDAVGTVLKRDPTLKVVIEGHTDAAGDDDYNRRLSERRAVSVKGYLMRTHDVAPTRIVTRGKGEAEPLATNPYDGVNRRVQFGRVG